MGAHDRVFRSEVPAFFEDFAQSLDSSVNHGFGGADSLDWPSFGSWPGHRSCWRRSTLGPLDYGLFITIAAALAGAAVAFASAALVLRKQLRAIGKLPDQNKKLRAREVQLAMLRSTLEQRRERLRQVLTELEQQSEETLTFRAIEETAITVIAEFDAKAPDDIRREIHARSEVDSGRRARSEFSSAAAIQRRLEMIQSCRKELDIPNDSSSLPYRDCRTDIA